MALVIKEWKTNPAAQGVEARVLIKGRQEGLLSFLFSLIGIDPTTTMHVDAQQMIFTEASWSGQRRSILPLKKVTSTYFGYTKPWKEALFIGIVLMPFFFLGLIVGPLYYFLNKQLELGVHDESGRTYSIAFKRSIIEGKNIDETEGVRIAQIIQSSIDNAGQIGSRAA